MGRGKPRAVTSPPAAQGEVWDCELNPVEGHEQAGRRPCLVVSVDQLGTGPSGLAIIVPVTRPERTALDVRIEPPEGGLDAPSFAQPYQVRAISRARLQRRRGRVRPATLAEVVGRVSLLIRAPG
jgi:mRNA interferase MazF